MLTKRMATVALVSAVLAKIAHADKPPPDTTVSKTVSPTLPPNPPSTFQGIIPTVPLGGGTQFSTGMTPEIVVDTEAFNRPVKWTVNLDQMTQLDVLLGGKKLTISAAEIFAALQS